jgi:hypothetical protein
MHVEATLKINKLRYRDKGDEKEKHQSITRPAKAGFRDC